MKMNFHGLNFELIGGRIFLTNCLDIASCKDQNKKTLFDFAEVQIAGENHSAHGGNKLFSSSESGKLKYISYSHTGNKLEIVQSSKYVSIASHFQAFEDTKTIRVWNTITNISNKPITIEHVSSFLCYGLGQADSSSVNDLSLYRFYNSWHVECQPIKHTFFDLGLFNGNDNRSMKKICGSNTGSWSTKEELPMAIVEDSAINKFFMFQIESNNSWYWEISDNSGLLYINLGGPNTTHNQWCKVLQPNCGFETVKTAIVSGGSINEVVGEMTKYRRNITTFCKPDKDLPVIFNEYMHLSWDNPNEVRTSKIVPTVAELGAKYYVIDCGWHDECDYTELYKKVGKWEPSQVRFPKGIKSTIALIKSYGMKAGLWIEPEIIGYECYAMQEFYGDDAFLKRNGHNIITSNRMFLDFRNQKVRKHMDEVIDRMVEYGIGYIKFDYNQDSGAGTELNSSSLGDGLYEHALAYFDWVKEVMKRHPSIIIEGCASGGHRMDYKTLSIHPLVSTSDQTNYKRYPYIAANILSAVLPEQAAVWSYPVESLGMDVFDQDTYESVNQRISTEQVIMNMINSMLGRMHLASAVHLLNDQKRELILEGINYYDKIVLAKKSALPYFPLGFSRFGQEKVVSGFVSKKTIYLAVWNLGGDGKFNIPINEYVVKGVKIAYPAKATEQVSFSEHNVCINLKENEYIARFLQIEIE